MGQILDYHSWIKNQELHMQISGEKANKNQLLKIIIDNIVPLVDVFKILSILYRFG